MSGVLGEWVTPDDLLIVGVRNALVGVTLLLSGRIWHLDGSVNEFAIPITPGSARALQFFQMQLEYGFLVSVTVQVAAGSPHHGQTLASILIARPPLASFGAKMLLAQDYVTTSWGPLWPGGRQAAGVDGQGMLYSIAVTTPGAGSDWTQTVPTGARWRVWGATATLATDAVAGVRIPSLVVDDGANILVNTRPGFTQTVSLTLLWGWGLGHQAPVVAPGTAGVEPSLGPLPLFAGWRIRTSTAALDVGDTWTGIRLLVEEWLED